MGCASGMGLGVALATGRRTVVLDGDGAAGSRFDKLHRVSVMVNAVQIVAVLAVMVRVGLG